MFTKQANTLNDPSKARAERLDCLRDLMAGHRGGRLPVPEATASVNNHIHSLYSFSPYSPAGAVYAAWQNGLAAAGLMDHDTMAGADEFLAAGGIVGLPVTVGAELRCDMTDTPFENRRINNPDQISLAYLAIHGIPRMHIQTVNDFLAPYRTHRNERNRAMTDRLGHLVAAYGLASDYDRDVLPQSMAHDGGAVTERHILYALALKMEDKIGRGQTLVDFLHGELGLDVSGANRQRLMETGEPYYAFAILNVLKSGLVERFYIDASGECPPVADFIRLAQETGSISAYAYLGDVAESVTGDKKAQAFEDAYLEELFAWLAGAGFHAVTYMPARNTEIQLRRVIGLCEQNGLFQISGEDINSPYQPFKCAALDLPMFRHLADSTYALIGHENAAGDDPAAGMFSTETMRAMPGLQERITHFANIGRRVRPA